MGPRASSRDRVRAGRRSVRRSGVCWLPLPSLAFCVRSWFRLVARDARAAWRPRATGLSCVSRDSGNRSLLLELADLLPRVAERFGEDQLGVLTELGPEAADRPGSLAEAHRQAADGHLAAHLL